jgi:hypothetical protein
VAESWWPGIAFLPLLVWLPGYLAFQSLTSDGERELGFSEALFIQVLTSVVLVSWLALVLAELGLFSWPGLLLGLALLCGLFGWMGKARLRHPTFPKPKPSLQGGLLIGLLIVAALLYFRPAETFLVLDDAGVYVLSGLHLAQTGDLFVHDPAVAKMLPEMAGEVFFAGPSDWTRFWGPFYLVNWWKDLVTFGFFHLFRLWIALFALLFGPQGSLWATPFFSLLGTAGLYFLGRRLFGQSVALLGAGLLAVNFVQVWSARYPLSECITQSFLLGGLYILVLFLERPNRYLGLMAGMCLGGLFLARVDTLPAIALLYLIIAYWRFRGEWSKEHTILLAALSLSLFYAIVHNVAFAWGYVVSLWRLAYSASWARLIAVAGLALTLVAVLGMARPAILKAIFGHLEANRRSVVWGLISSLVVFVGIYQLFLPAIWRGWTAYWLMQYWTPLGILLGLGGLFLALARGQERKAVPLLVLTLAYGGWYSLAPQVNQIQPWAMRRFVPLVLPALALFTAYALLSLPSLRWRLERVVQGVVIVALFIAFLSTTGPFLRYVEYQGAWEQLEQLAARFEDGSLIFFDKEDPSTHLSQPLAYLFHHEVFVLQRESPDAALLAQLAAARWQRGQSVYLVLTGGSLRWHTPELAFVPLGDFTLRVPLAERSFSHPPQRIEMLVYQLDIYRVVPADTVPKQSASLPLKLDMGPGEYSYLRGGFYGWATMPDGVTYRWTSGAATVAVPRPNEGGLRLSVRAAGGRLPEIKPATMTLLVAGLPVAEGVVPNGFGFENLSFFIPADRLPSGTDTVEIELRSDTWVPRAVGYNDDPRSLGIAVDWIRVEGQ